MRVGFITQLLWPRYGTFWQRLVSGVEADVVFASKDNVLKRLQDPRLQDIPGIAFRLAAAQALALQDADVLIAPDLNPDVTTSRGSGQDPWVSSFPDALATTLSGLPPVIAVPAELNTQLETLAISVLHQLSRDPALIKRVWSRQRSATRQNKPQEPTWTLRPSDTKTVAIIAQPWLLNDTLIASFKQEGVHVVSQQQLDFRFVREEGYRFEKRLVATDSEVLGAARYLSRKGSVKELVYIADQSAGGDVWMVSQLQQLVHKPVRVHYMQELLSSEALFDSLFVEVTG